MTAGDLADMAADPADMAADRESGSELVALVAAAAEGLGPRDQVVLELHAPAGLEGQELGDAIGVSASHAYVLVSRACATRWNGRWGRCRPVKDGTTAPTWRLCSRDGTVGSRWCGGTGRPAMSTGVARRRRTPAGPADPSTLLGGAAPAFALPAACGTGSWARCSSGHTGPRGRGEEGFRRRWPVRPAGGARASSAAAVAILILVAAAALQVLGNEPASTEVAAVGPPPTAGPDGAGLDHGADEPAHDLRPRSLHDDRRDLPPLIIDPVPGPGPGPTTTTGPSTTTTTPVGPPTDTTPPELTAPRFPETVAPVAVLDTIPGHDGERPGQRRIRDRVRGRRGRRRPLVGRHDAPRPTVLPGDHRALRRGRQPPDAVTARAVDVAGNEAADTACTGVALRPDPRLSQPLRRPSSASRRW